MKLVVDVLLVMREPIDAELLGMSLEGDGLVVHLNSDVERACQWIRDGHRTRVVVTDSAGPGATVLANTLRINGGAVPLIVLSASRAPTVPAGTRLVHAPFRADDVVAAIHAAIDEEARSSRRPTGVPPSSTRR